VRLLELRSGSWRARLGLALLAGVLAGGLAAPAPTAVAAAGARTATVVHPRLRAAIRDLPVKRETRAGYDRDSFKHWVDADGDCQDTRDEVLAAESLVEVSGCDIQRGKWFSYYDHVRTKDSGTFDIDHLVPLAEAWDSGAKRWSADTRERYANDLGDHRALVAVSASSNRSKGDRDPAEWLPEFGHCRYLRQWVAVKVRWSLAVDTGERDELRSLAADCTNVVLTVRKAKID
jgi:uncharacterized protein DUF1524